MRYISFLILVVIGIQCNTSSTDNTVHAFETIIYGTVTGVDESNYQNIRIFFSAHRYGCDSPKIKEGKAHVDKTGDYRFLYHSSFIDSQDICHQATLKYIQEGAKDNLLLAPKKIEANWKDDPPYDSTRIDFKVF